MACNLSNNILYLGLSKTLKTGESIMAFFKLQFNMTLEPVDVRAVIEANNIKWKPSDAQCIDILEEAYRKSEIGLSASDILWAIEEQLDFDDFCKEGFK